MAGRGIQLFKTPRPCFASMARAVATRYPHRPSWATSSPLPGGGPLANALAMDDLRVRPRPLDPDKMDVEVPEDLGFLRRRTATTVGGRRPVAYWRDVPGLTFVQRSSDLRWGDRSATSGTPTPIPSRPTSGTTSTGGAMGRTATRGRRGSAPLQAISRDAFLRGMRRFSTDWRFRHPYPEDFYLSPGGRRRGDPVVLRRRLPRHGDDRLALRRGPVPSAGVGGVVPVRGRSRRAIAPRRGGGGRGGYERRRGRRRGLVSGRGRGGEGEEALRLRRRPAPAGSCSCRSRCS